MPKINKDNIIKQLGRMEVAYEDMAVMSKPMSLSIKEIQLNPENVAAQHDSDEEIRALADSIQTSGLIHPLTVNKIGEHQYMLLSGERRFKAITTYLDWENVQCTVYEDLDPSLAVVVTVEANMETREYSVADRLALYQQLDAALRDLKAKGKYKGGIGRGIAKMMGVSEQQVGKYKRLTAELSTEEIKNITNIDQAVMEIRGTSKTESDFQFLPPESSPSPPSFKAEPYQSSDKETGEAQKTESDFQFLSTSESSSSLRSSAVEPYQLPDQEIGKAQKTESDFQFFESSSSPSGPDIKDKSLDKSLKQLDQVIDQSKTSMHDQSLLFVNKEHAGFYNEKTRELKADIYLKSLIYTIGICCDTRRRWNSIYDEKKKEIHPEQISEPWQTGASQKVTRLAFQLFTDGTPTTDVNDKNVNFVKDNIDECRRYSVSDIFCCEFAPYFVQAVQIRYPDYFKKEERP